MGALGLAAFVFDSLIEAQPELSTNVWADMAFVNHSDDNTINSQSFFFFLTRQCNFFLCHAKCTALLTTCLSTPWHHQ